MPKTKQLPWDSSTPEHMGHRKGGKWHIFIRSFDHFN